LLKDDLRRHIGFGPAGWFVGKADGFEGLVGRVRERRFQFLPQ
jgi:hypothetical protein